MNKNLNLKSKTLQKKLQKGQGASDTISKISKELESLSVSERLESQMMDLARARYNSELTDRFIINLTRDQVALKIQDDDYEIRHEGGASVTRFNTAIFQVESVGPDVKNPQIVPSAYVWMNEQAFSGAAKSTPWGDRKGFLVVDEFYILGIVEGDFKQILEPSEEFIAEYRNEFESKFLQGQNIRRRDLNLSEFKTFEEAVQKLENDESSARTEAALKALNKIEA